MLLIPFIMFDILGLLFDELRNLLYAFVIHILD